MNKVINKHTIRGLTKHIAQNNLRLSTIKLDISKLEKERNERTVVNNHNIIELSYLNYRMKQNKPIFYDYEYPNEIPQTERYSEGYVVNEPHNNS